MGVGGGREDCVYKKVINYRVIKIFEKQKNRVCLKSEFYFYFFFLRDKSWVKKFFLFEK